MGASKNERSSSTRGLQYLLVIVILTIFSGVCMQLASGEESDDISSMISTYNEIELKSVSLGAPCDLKANDGLTQDAKKLITATKDLKFDILSPKQSLADLKSRYNGVKTAKDNFNSYKAQAGEICKAKDDIVCEAEDPTKTPPPPEGKGICKNCNDSSLLTDKGKANCATVELMMKFEEESSSVVDLLKKIKEGQDAIESGKQKISDAKNKGKETLKKVSDVFSSESPHTAVLSQVAIAASAGLLLSSLIYALLYTFC